MKKISMLLIVAIQLNSSDSTTIANGKKKVDHLKDWDIITLSNHKVSTRVPRAPRELRAPRVITRGGVNKFRLSSNK